MLEIEFGFGWRDTGDDIDYCGYHDDPKKIPSTGGEMKINFLIVCFSFIYLR